MSSEKTKIGELSRWLIHRVKGACLKREMIDGNRVTITQYVEEALERQLAIDEALVVVPREGDEG